MKPSEFKFYDFTKKGDIQLLPNSELLKDSTLVPKSTAARRRKYDDDKSAPPYGPAEADGMGSALLGNDGYGELDYGEAPYGEAVGSKSPMRFAFYAPRKQQDITLVPHSDIVQKSALVAGNSKAKKRKPVNSVAFGPAEAFGMANAMHTIAGYGNSGYGARPYGEARDNIKKSADNKKYQLYSKHIDMCESL